MAAFVNLRLLEISEEVYKNVSDGDFTDDENDFDENVEDYYAFKDAIQNSFIDFDYFQEVNNYCLDDYNSNEEIIDEFKDSAKKVEDFKRTLLIPQGFENIDSFYYAILYAIRCQLKNTKIECQNDDELKKDIDNDKLYDNLSAAKEKLRLDLF